MTEAVKAGLIQAEARTTLRRASDGSTYKTVYWVVTPSPSVAAALQPWTTYGLDDPKVRKPRETARVCPECGDVQRHPPPGLLHRHRCRDRQAHRETSCQ